MATRASRRRRHTQSTLLPSVDDKDGVPTDAVGDEHRRQPYRSPVLMKSLEEAKSVKPIPTGPAVTGNSPC
jgi:hypothetical protein